MSATTSPGVFISYARSDGRSVAERLFGALRDHRVDAYFDQRSMDPSQDYTATIEDAIVQATHVAVCITADSKRSDSFVRREIQYALDVPKPIVPLRFQPVLPHIHIATIPFIDFFDRWDVAFSELLERLYKPLDDHDFGRRPPDPFQKHVEQLLHFVVGELRQTVNDSDEIVELLTTGGTSPSSLTPVPDQQRALPAAYRSRRPSWSRADERRQPGERHFSSFAAAFEHQDHRAILLGEPGAGKTTTVLVAAREAAIKRLEDSGSAVPIYAPIRTWDGKQDLISWMATVTELEQELLSSAVKHNQAVLFFDGLDELRQVSLGESPGEDPRLGFLRAIGHLGLNAWVITCRSPDFDALVDSPTAEMMGGGLIRLLALTDDQIGHYLFDDPDLLAAIQSDDALREMARNPLMLRLLALAFRDEAEQAVQLRSLRNSPAELRSRIVDKYVTRRYEFECSRHDSDYRPRFSVDALSAGLGAIAMDVLNQFAPVEVEIGENSYTITRTESGTVDFVEFDSRSVCHRLGAAAFPLLELAKRLRLVVSVHPLTFRFAHLMLRDHFAFKHCIDALDGRHKHDRRAAAGALGLIGDRRAVPKLIRALYDEDDTVQVLAIWSLGEIGDSSAVEPLLERIRQTQDPMRANLRVEFGFEALGKLGEPGLMKLMEVLQGAPEELIGPTVADQMSFSLAGQGIKGMAQAGSAAVPLLLRLAGSDYRFKEPVMDALIDLGDPRAVDFLIEALDDPISSYDAVRGLAKIGDERALPALLKERHRTIWGRWNAIGAIGGPKAIAALSTALGNEETHRREGRRSLLRRRAPSAQVAMDPQTRVEAATALGRIGGDEALTALSGALWDRDLRVRGAAMEALEKAGYDPSTLEAARPNTHELLSALDSGDDATQVAAAKMLATRGEPEVVDALLTAASRSSGWARQEMLIALAAHGSASAVEPLACYLFRSDFMSGSVDESVATALGRVPSSEAAWYLVAALDDSLRWTRETVMNALSSVGPLAVGPLMDALQTADPGFKHLVASAIARLGDVAAGRLCEQLGTDLGPIAAETLAAIGPPAVPVLLTALNDPSSIVRARAANALGRIDDDRAVEGLVLLLGDNSRAVRNAGGSALGELGTRSVAGLIAKLSSRGQRHRAIAAEVLGYIGDERSLRPLLGALSDDDPLVRRSAVSALAIMAEVDIEPDLRRMLDDPDALVRSAAVDALTASGASEAGFAAYRPSTSDLTAAMRRADPDHRLVAVTLLSLHAARDAGSLPSCRVALCSALSDPDSDVRLNAARGLAQLRYFRELVAGLRSADDGVRVACRQALSEAQEIELEPVRGVLSDQRPEARAAAAAVLAAWHDPEAVDGMIALLGDPDTMHEVSEALAEMPDASGERLVQLLPDSRLGAIALTTICRIGEGAVMPMIALLGNSDERYRVCAANVLHRLGRPAVQPLIDTLQRDSDTAVRIRAAEVLGRIRHPRGLAVLREIAQPRDLSVGRAESADLRAAAAAALPPSAREDRL